MENPKILLIEDDQMLVKMYKIKLEKEGFDVEIAYNGEEGLELMKSQKYDVILLDLMMPVMDGFVMLERHKEDPNKQDTPIIVLSNLGQKEDIERAVELGVGEDDYIVKANMTPMEVIEKIRTKLDNVA